jgi:hypothetical protein
LRAPERGDFRPTPAAAGGRGARVFVPWGLRAVVGEWGFHHAGDDPTLIPDEHFHLAPQYVDRTEYHRQPVFPLRAVNVTDADYVAGPLEDWTRGALRFDGRTQYAVLAAAAMGPRPPSPMAVTNAPADWVRIDAPATAAAGAPFEVTLTLSEDHPGQKLRADLHALRRDGSFGGMNAWGGDAQPATAGPHVFRFAPKASPGLGAFQIAAWLTPTGEWADHAQLARHAIPAAEPPASGDIPSPRIRDSSFLVEAYFRTEPGHAGGVVVESLREAGFSLTIAPGGGARFAVRAGGEAREVTGATAVNDGVWHHVVAEADRVAGSLALYVDGRRDAQAPGPGPGASLAHEGDLHVGGTPDGRGLAGAMEFLRISLGTLADAKTTIEELYAWEFDGPFLRDFTGEKRPEGRWTAGALEAAP